MLEASALEVKVPVPDLPPSGHGLVREGVWVVSDTGTVIYRNLWRFTHTPDLAVATIVAPSIFLALFRLVFGGAITDLDGVPYIDYLVPGMAALSAILNSGNSGFALADDRGSGLLDRLRSMPMSRSSVLIGRVVADAAANAIGLALLVVLSFGLGFHPRAVSGLVAGFVLVLLFAMSTSFMFALVGLYASNAQAVNAATLPIIFPLCFISSALVPTRTMPGWLQGFAGYQPISIVVDAFRSLTVGTMTSVDRQALFLGQSTGALVVESLGWSVVTAVLFGALAVRRYSRSG